MNTITNSTECTWEDIKNRDDLNIIPLMEKNGWNRSFHYSDLINQKIYPNNPPDKPVSFKKDNYSIWKTITNKWIIATQISNHYTKQKEFNTPLNALDFFINNPNYFNVV